MSSQKGLARLRQLLESRIRDSQPEFLILEADNARAVDKDHSAVPHPRLNPFAFPSGTTYRFVLLIAAVLSGGLLLSSFGSAPDLGSVPSCLESAMNMTCANAFAGGGSILERAAGYQGCIDNSTNGALIVEELSLQILACIIPAQRTIGFRTLFAALLMSGMAAFIYWLFPRWKIWRTTLEPLDTIDAPEIARYLDELCREVSLARSPTFLVNALNPTIGGLAFGRRGEYYVAMSGGLIAQFYTDRAAFRAIMLHELAHIYNADIDKTYFAMACWYSFVIAALFALGTSLASAGGRGILGYAWRLSAFGGLVYLTRNSILRARETYADVRASLWEGRNEALPRVLEAMPRGQSSLLGRWGGLIGVHPDPTKRLQMVNDPSALFGLPYWVIFGSGIVFMIGFTSLYSVLRIFLAFLPLSSGIFWILLGTVTGLFLSPLVIGLVVVGIWRRAFADVPDVVPSQSVALLALCIGSGIFVGDLISLSGVGRVELPWLSELVRSGFLSLWYLSLLLCLFLFLKWLASSLAVWFEVSGSERRSHVYRLAGLIGAGSLFFALWFGMLYAFRDRLEFVTPTPFPADIIYLLIVGFRAITESVLVSFLPLVFCLIWVVPLAARFFQREPATWYQHEWAFIERPPPSAAFSAQPPFRLRFALTLGIVGGLLAAIPVVSQFTHLLGQGAEPTTSSQLMKVADAIGKLSLYQSSAQVVVAGITAYKVKRVGWAHGMFAAFVVGCMAFLGELVILQQIDYPVDAAFLFYQFSSIIIGGSVPALLITLTLALAGQITKMPPFVLESEQALAKGNTRQLVGEGFGRRTVAFVIDIAIWRAITFAMSFALVIPLAFLTGNFEPTVNTSSDILAGLGSLLLYFIIFEWICGSTVGKLMLGLSVIQEDGAACNLKRATTRNLLRYLDILLVFIPTFVVRQAPLEQSFGDKVAKTVVVKRFGQPGLRKRFVLATAVLFLANSTVFSLLVFDGVINF